MTTPLLILATSPRPGELSRFMDAGPYSVTKGGPVARSKYLASVARDAGTTLVASSLSPLVRGAADECAAQILGVGATE